MFSLCVYYDLYDHNTDMSPNDVNKPTQIEAAWFYPDLTTVDISVTRFGEFSQFLQS